MSTDNIATHAEEALKALGQLAHAAEDRLKDVRKEREGNDKQKVSVAQGAHLAMRRLQDVDEGLAEEESQLAAALSMPTSSPSGGSPNGPDDGQTPPVSPASPATPTTPFPVVIDNQPNRIYTRPELNQMSNEQLQRLAAERCNVHVMVTDANRHSIILIIWDAQPPRRRSNFDPRGYSGVQWVCAFLGLILAIILWTRWPEWPARNMDEGGLRTFVNFVWFIAHAGAGFLTGGWIGSVIDRRRNRQ